MAGRVISWEQFDQRADSLARHFLDGPVSKSNRRSPPTCTMGLSTSRPISPHSKAGLTPVNTNYRYVADELIYLFDNADAEAVVFRRRLLPPPSSRFGGDSKGTNLGRCIRPRRQGSSISPPIMARWPTAGQARPSAPGGGRATILLILYTGGTTGMPKGVMWRQGGSVLCSRRRWEHPFRGCQTVRVSRGGGDPGRGPSIQAC